MFEQAFVIYGELPNLGVLCAKMADNSNGYHLSNDITDPCFGRHHFHQVNYTTNNSCNGSNQLHMSHKSNKSDEFRITKRRGRPIVNNAARERSRVKTLRSAFLELQRTLPAVPPDTKLSKLDVLVLATTYIAHLMSALQDDGDVTQVFAANGCMHPVKKWPMRTRLYAGILSSTVTCSQDNQDTDQYQTTVAQQPLPWSHKHS